MTTLINTLDKLHQLESFYRHGYQSEVVDRALEKIIALEHAQALRELRTIEVSLTQFERNRSETPLTAATQPDQDEPIFAVR